MRKINVIFLFVLFLSICQTDLFAQKTKFLVERPVIPVLVGKDVNPTIRVDICSDTNDVLPVRTMVLDFTGTTNLDDISEILIYGTLSNGRMDYSKCFANKEISSYKCEMNNISIDSPSFWIAVSLREKVSLNNRICVNVSSMKGRNHEDIIPSQDISRSVPLRIGYALRQKNENGIASSRIPGISTHPSGTLLAVFDARYNSPRDLQGNIDIGLRRSFDGGDSWEPLQIVLDRGRWGHLDDKYNGISDANIVVDTQNGTVFVFGLWMYGMLDDEGKWISHPEKTDDYWIHQWHKKGSQPGLRPKQTCQFLMTRSDDGGKTWSRPQNITRKIKNPDWWLYAPCPGHGITMDDGTLVIPTQGRDEKGIPFSNIAFSRDAGKTWESSEIANKMSNECNAVQLSDGSIMLNMRNLKPFDKTSLIGRGRCVSITDDLGKTWIKHVTSERVLPEPVCMGSIHKHCYHVDGKRKSILLFANPDNTDCRDRLTLKVSFDDGLTWPEENRIMFDQYRSAGYSSITSVSEDEIGILYESNLAELVFIRIPLEELINN